MRGEVAIAESEPGVPVESLQCAEHVTAVAANAPTAIARCQARQGVDDGVEIRRNVEPVKLLVVAGVDDDGQVIGIDERDEAA